MGHVFFCHCGKAEGVSPALQGWGLVGRQRAHTLCSIVTCLAQCFLLNPQVDRVLLFLFCWFSWCPEGASQGTFQREIIRTFCH